MSVFLTAILLCLSAILLCLLATAAMAQTVAPVAPAVPPFDPSTIVPALLALGLGKYVAGILAFYATLCGIASILAPWVPVPGPASNTVYVVIYKAFNWVLAHNYRNASNAVKP